MTRTERITDFLNSIEINNLNIMDYINPNEVNSFENIEEDIENGGGFEVEIIYYHNAMKYLSEHDPSLTEATELAFEYGYESKDLNSELLATILASHKVRNDFYLKHDEIEEFFEELEIEVEV